MKVRSVVDEKGRERKLQRVKLSLLTGQIAPSQVHKLYLFSIFIPVYLYIIDREINR
jgi:hypothetical protein